MHALKYNVSTDFCRHLQITECAYKPYVVKKITGFWVGFFWVVFKMPVQSFPTITRIFLSYTMNLYNGNVRIFSCLVRYIVSFLSAKVQSIY